MLPESIASMFTRFKDEPLYGQLEGTSKSDFYYEKAENHLHGYSSQTRLLPIAFAQGANETVRDMDGNLYIDFTSGTYCAGLGHGNRRIQNAVSTQLANLENCHSWLAPIKVTACEELGKTLPKQLQQFEFYTDGATAVEAALRLVNVASPNAHLQKIITFEGSYHGKTAGASLLTFRPTLGSIKNNSYKIERLPYPNLDVHEDDTSEQKEYWENRWLNMLNTVGPATAIFVEPIQGVSGCIRPTLWFLPLLERWCKSTGTLLVVDEIFTGGLRTGSMWSSCFHRIIPDILIFGKILGGGMPISGLATSEQIVEKLNGSSVTSTFGGNPVSMAAMLESLKILKMPELIENVHIIGTVMRGYLGEIGVKNNGMGCMHGFKFSSKEKGIAVFKELAKRGVITQIEGDVCRLCPPLTSNPTIIAEGMEIMVEVIQRLGL